MTDEDFSRRKEDILARVDLVELADALGLQPAGKKDRHCPAHTDQGRPNLHLYAKEAHCFACGFHADAFDLVAKVKGLDFAGAFDFLAARFGLPLIQDLRKSGPQGGAAKGRGLGYRGGVMGQAVYPKPPPAAPLPGSPSPTLSSPPPGHLREFADTTAVELADQGAGLGYEGQGEGATVYPKPPAELDDQVDQVAPGAASGGGLPALPGELARNFPTLAEAWQYGRQLAGAYHFFTGKDPVTGDFFVDGTARPARAVVEPPPAAAPDDPVAPGAGQKLREPDRRSLRVEVFTALLDRATAASTTAAGDWLEREKGITKATQDRFRLAFLDDPHAAAAALVTVFGLDDLLALGIYGKGKEGKPYFAFKRHTLLFPFRWKGEVVDVQGRDVTATDKAGRFRNTGGANPIPFNADALVEARERGEPVFLCEGATDTLSLAQSGRLAVGIVGTGGFKPSWLPYFGGLTVFLAFDSDEAGQKAAAAVTKVFFDGGQPAPKVIKLPVKDVTDFFRNQAK